MILSRRSGLLAALTALGGALAGCSTSTTPAGQPARTPTEGRPSGDAGTPPVSGSTPTATVPGVPDPLPAGVVTALILGTDSNRDNTNSDVMVVAQLSADRRQVTLCSIPRDCYVPIAGGGKSKINSALATSGISGVKRTVSDLFGGLTLNYVAQTNFTDFVDLCVLLDGFSVQNKIAASFPHEDGTKTYFPAGTLTQHADGWLFYVRQRKQLPRGDFDRGERHRAVITGMIRHLKGLLARPAAYADVAARVFDSVRVYGGIDATNVLGLTSALQAIDAGRITSLRVPTAGSGSAGGLTDVVFVDADRLRELAAGLRAGDVSAYVRQYGAD
nr:LCP family protein [Propionibacterium sp.]